CTSFREARGACAVDSEPGAGAIRVTDSRLACCLPVDERGLCPLSRVHPLSELRLEDPEYLERATGHSTAVGPVLLSVSEAHFDGDGLLAGILSVPDDERALGVHPGSLANLQPSADDHHLARREAVDRAEGPVDTEPIHSLAEIREYPPDSSQ